MEVKLIRNRRHSVLVRLNEQEHEHLHELVQQAGLPQEKLLRKIIAGYQVKAAPPIDYHEMIRQLMVIGKNINQIASAAKSLGMIESIWYIKNYKNLLHLILQIETAIEGKSDAK